MSNIVYRTAFLLLLLVMGIKTVAQCNKIDYEMIITDNTNIPNSPNFLQEMKSKQKQVTFSLIFDNEHQKFEPKKTNTLNIEDYQFLLIFADNEGALYKNNKSDFLITEKFGYGILENELSKKKVKTNWTIGIEQKLILNYLCTKATGQIFEDCGNGWEEKFNQIEAWFCPTIQPAFGPKCFGGLPGMILELQWVLVKFTAKSINQTANQPNFAMPNQQKVPFENVFCKH
jgi:GLPGLI family protein